MLLVLSELLHLGLRHRQLITLNLCFFMLFFGLVLQMLLLDLAFMLIWIILEQEVTGNQPRNTEDLLDGLELPHLLDIAFLSLDRHLLEELETFADFLHELLGLLVVGVFL